MSHSHAKKLILSIILTDRTFSLSEYRGKTVWVGKCIHCGKFLTVDEDGSATKTITIEHILPKNSGGTDDLLNLAIACFSCNNIKGRTHDRTYPKNPVSVELIEKLLKKRKNQWRNGP